MSTQNAAAIAAAGVQNLVDAVNEHGIGSPQADQAAADANALVAGARAAGATDDDIKNARH
ncbi:MULTISPECIES: hypothetical protein [Streptomyces]|uniref:hypothetical protein n=1 Tax=Streptomyces TaxID=1883 RepID=UPI0004CDDB6F|nr:MULTISPECIES: hypothetical protein [Streptomyces]